MGSTRWRCARLSLIRDDSGPTEAARHGEILLSSVALQPWRPMATALNVANSE
jgi:hypothetical protein